MTMIFESMEMMLYEVWSIQYENNFKKWKLFININHFSMFSPKKKKYKFT